MILVGHIPERVAAMEPQDRLDLFAYLNTVAMKVSFTDNERAEFFDQIDKFAGKAIHRAGCKDCILQTASAIRMEIKLHLRNSNG